MDKKATVEKFGAEQVNVWRRSYNIPPPPCELDSPHCPANDPKYASIPEAQNIRTESLEVTFTSTLFFFWHQFEYLCCLDVCIYLVDHFGSCCSIFPS